MKTTFIYALLSLVLLGFGNEAFAQTSGKFYTFSTGKKVRKVKVQYESAKDRLTLSGGVKQQMGRRRIKGKYTFKYKVYDGKRKTMFLLEGGDWLFANISRPSSKEVNGTKVTYKEAKHGDVVYLSTDKNKAKAMTKEKAIQLFEDAFSDIERVYNAKKMERVAKTQLPKEQMKDPKLLKISLAAAERFMRSQGWKETLKGGYIFDKKWNIIRNKYSGIVVARSIRVVGLVTRGSKCFFTYFFIRQKRSTGNKFDEDRTVCRGSSGIDQITCDKLTNKLRK